MDAIVILEDSEFTALPVDGDPLDVDTNPEDNTVIVLLDIVWVGMVVNAILPEFIYNGCSTASAWMKLADKGCRPTLPEFIYNGYSTASPSMKLADSGFSVI